MIKLQDIFPLLFASVIPWPSHVAMQKTLAISNAENSGKLSRTVFPALKSMWLSWMVECSRKGFYSAWRFFVSITSCPLPSRSSLPPWNCLVFCT